MDNEHLEKGEWMSRDVTPSREKRQTAKQRKTVLHTHTHICIYIFIYTIFMMGKSGDLVVISKPFIFKFKQSH